MVGMEQLEVHSRSYLIRWINVQAGNTISWSIQPHKKSLNFGVFKHPGGNSVGLPTTPQIPQTPGIDISLESDEGNGKPSKRGSKKEDVTVVEKLEKLGMKSVAWMGRCEAEKVTMGSYDVLEGDGGMYGLVFDNTFSKQLSKTVTFVLMTYPTGAPPVSGHHLHYSQANGSQSTQPSPSLGPEIPATTPPSEGNLSKVSSSVINDPRPRSAHGTEIKTSLGSSAFYTGVLHKQRRKHHTYAKRFFSLDFTSSTLSYYRNRNSSALRGSIPLSLAVISTDEKTRQISVDSGAEIWHLRAGNQKDFLGWRDALSRASHGADMKVPKAPISVQSSRTASQAVSDPAEARDWARAEALVGRVSGIRDAVRRLAQDCDPKYQPSSSGLGINSLSVPSPADSGNFDYFTPDEASASGQQKLPFWKRKSSSNNVSPGAVFRRSFSAQLAVPMAGNVPTQAQPARQHSHPYSMREPDDEGVHEHCVAIMRDLDQVVSEFSQLISESKQRRLPPISPLSRRGSVGSVSDDEFFDAEDSAGSHSGMLKITHDSDFEGETERESVSDSDSDSGSEADFEAVGSFTRKPREGHASLFPPKPKSLSPLPLSAVPRRKTVPPPKVPPPSLISFLRKNVGKDLSTIAMPVSANEPTSLLQRVAEQMEYSELLDAAANTNDATMRILNIAAFAVSSFSSSRVKDRAIRKPFNPMLGETFELVREDKGYRFIAEKISHRPVRMACQAEAEDWTFLQAPMPVQKFWGKSAELNTEGRVRVFLHTVGEAYSWTLATSFLRNVIAGEKYVEPVSTMTVICETTGMKAIATFKAGGMFAGRSEEVTVQAFDGSGQQLPHGLGGKWTSHLNVSDNSMDTGKTLWKVGPLVEDAAKRYGFTVFAAALNQITAIEEGFIPPTDSRLRPDQRALEDGDVDRAEALKARLEERQRGRRRVMEEHGEQWAPKWFYKAGVEGDEEIWRLKSGKDNYWEARSRKDWTGVIDVLEA
ncbi:uncharacterized protein PV09_07483 [Verruconis gallopava]|uniref:PH domain-containing protein n=1 Tax=Verruconis gallopava TaxID=253628 RepID=A0A0D1XFI6_9PEZI|nr:uncharacterized protein PV09_07483 [Verruconis gallopava]KIW00961.1 hypothetical protein PV09_07483 [Verruconis gallopava]